MEIHTPVVAFFIPLILSRWRTIEGVPLNSHRKIGDELFELMEEKTVGSTLDQIDSFLLGELIEETKEDLQSSLHKTKRQGVPSITDRNTVYSTEKLRQLISSSSSDYEYDYEDTLSSLSFEEDLINSILRNLTQPTVPEIPVPYDVSQSFLEDLFTIPKESVSPRSPRSKRGYPRCENRGDKTVLRNPIRTIVKLCKTCSEITTFDDGFEPRRVNEVYCDVNSGESRNTCLTGRGECVQRTRSIYRYRVENGILETRRDTIRVGCECNLYDWANIVHLACPTCQAVSRE